MKNTLFPILTLLLIITSCKKTEPCVKEDTIEVLTYEITSTTTLDEDNQTITDLYQEIKVLSESKTCTDASLWQFTAYGSKACGGPIGYITYHNCINTADFLNKIELFTNLQHTHNLKYGAVSICDVPPPPSSIFCQDGVAKLIY